jgi:hypothetical protein
METTNETKNIEDLQSKVEAANQVVKALAANYPFQTTEEIQEYNRAVEDSRYLRFRLSEAKDSLGRRDLKKI